MALAVLAAPALLSVQSAAASTPTSVSPGTVAPASTIAGGNTSYSIPFTTSASGALNTANPTITFVGPSGTVFPACPNPCSGYTIKAATGSATVQSAVVSSAAGPNQTTVSSTTNQVVITLASSTIGAGDLVTVDVSSVENPVTAGSYVMAESTSADTQPADSPSYSITAGPPTQVVATGGDNQTTPASSKFPAALTATVADDHGNPTTVSSSYEVQFSIGSASGASATFSAPSGNTTMEQDPVGSDGQSISTIPTANATTGGPYSVTATLWDTTTNLAVPGVTTATFNLENAPVTVTQVTPGAVTLSNHAAAAKPVTFTIPFTTSPSGALSSASTITLVAPSGTTLPACTAACTTNYQIGVSNGGTATIATVAASTSGGSATNNKIVITLGAATIAGGDIVTITAGGTLSGAEVVNPTVATTTDYIQESTSSDTSPVDSPYYAIVPGPPAKVVPISGGGQSAQTASQFAAPLAVEVEDSYGNGVPGQTVNFSIVAAPSGASATFANKTTAEADVTDSTTYLATTSFLTANGTPGGPFSVTASVTGVSGTASFSGSQGLTNTNGEVAAGPVTLNPTTMAGATSNYSLSFSTSPSGAMSGCSATPADCTVTLTAPAGTIWPAKTNGNGNANYTAQAGGNSLTIAAANLSPSGNEVVIDLGTDVADSEYLSFTISGVTNPTKASGSYALQESTFADNTVATSGAYQITPAAAQNITVEGGSAQSAAPGTNFAQPLSVLVTDQYGNPVDNVDVTFTAPASTTAATATFGGCSGAGSNASTCVEPTDNAGLAKTSTLTADSVQGSYSVTASMPTGSTLFKLTNAQVLTPLMISVSPDAAGATSVYTVPFITSTNGAIPSTPTCFGSPGAPCQVNLVAPNGTALPGSVSSYQVTVNNDHAVTLSDVALSSVQGPGSSTVSPTPNQAVLSFAASSIAAGDTVTVTISGVTNPTAAGSGYTFEESTSSDTGLMGSPSYTITAAAAKSVSIVTGNPQSTTVGTAFPTQMEVNVVDAYGNPVPGETVTFAAPASGPSGTFATCPGATSTSTSCVVTTDSQGDATALPFTANGISGTYQVTVSAGTISASNTPAFTLNNLPPTMNLVKGTSPQEATTGTAYGPNLEVQVVDTQGNPVSGVSVTFTAPSSGPSGTFASCPGTGSTSTVCVEPTDSSGDATASTFTANDQTGSFTVSASTPAASDKFFDLTNVPPTVNIVTGSNQSTTVGTNFTPLEVQVLDVKGNPMNGVTVTFTAPSSGPSGTFASCPGTGSTSTVCVEPTDSSGDATASTFTANDQAGSFTVSASTPTAATQSFDLTNNHSSASKAVIVSGDPQTATTSQCFGAPLAVEVLDGFGNPVPGVTVTFIAPSSGATATFGTCGAGSTATSYVATTGSNGIATSAGLTADSIEGSYQVEAVVSGVTNPDVFDLTNVHHGYWMVGSDGGIFTFGNAPYYGSEGSTHLNAPIVGMAAAEDGNGYYLVASDGGVFNFGPGAPYEGSMGGKHLNAPVVGIAVDPTTGGYWLAAADGGVFNFGGAQFYGSHGNAPLNKPIVGIGAAPGGGYYLVASDGGIFNYGPGATFYGSHGGSPLNQPVVGMAVTPGGGYYLVASDGGIFNYGPGATFYGSHGGSHLNQPAVGMAVDPEGLGYWLVARDGGIFNYGDAPYDGSEGSVVLNAPIVGMASSG